MTELQYGLTKTSIIKLARRAGVKSLSEDCYDTIRNFIKLKLQKWNTI